MQALNIDCVHRLAIGRFHNYRQARHPGVVDQQAEGFQANFAVPDVRVPVRMTPEGFLRIVGVNDLQPAQANDCIKLGHCRRVSLRRPNIIARRENVAGVEAHGQPLRLFNALNNPRQMLEPPAEICPLPRRGFQRDPYFGPRRLRMNRV